MKSDPSFGKINNFYVQSNDSKKRIPVTASGQGPKNRRFSHTENKPVAPTARINGMMRFAMPVQDNGTKKN